MSAPAPRSTSQSSPSRVLEETEEMPYTLGDLDAIYREPQEPQQQQPPPQQHPHDLPFPRDPQDSLEQDLTALQETLEKEMLEMDNSTSIIMPPPPTDIEDESLELQEIMVDDVVASEVVLEEDVFGRHELFDEDPQEPLKDDDFE